MVWKQYIIASNNEGIVDRFDRCGPRAYVGEISVLIWGRDRAIPDWGILDNVAELSAWAQTLEGRI